MKLHTGSILSVYIVYSCNTILPGDIHTATRMAILVGKILLYYNCFSFVSFDFEARSYCTALAGLVLTMEQRLALNSLQTPLS